MSRDQRSLLRRRYLGFVFQGFNLLARTSAAENVELPLIYRGERKEARREAALRALDRVGLVPWADHTPAELSGGQQRRVAIARALVADPEVLLADEPTGNLNSERSLEIMEFLGELNKTGIAILMVTHEPEMAEFAKTIVHFKDGLVERIRRGTVKAPRWESPDVRHYTPARLARNQAAHHAQLPDDARHHHQHSRGHHHGHVGQGRDGRHREADQLAGFEVFFVFPIQTDGASCDPSTSET